uniref:Uncharacterized protein n=1 Tax=Mycena chlorophos TaxID=658473 RepID=A0ABQ0L0I4_MYCCL|nr:predicted protein [Mycena chlorophos]
MLQGGFKLAEPRTLARGLLTRLAGERARRCWRRVKWAVVAGSSSAETSFARGRTQQSADGRSLGYRQSRRKALAVLSSGSVGVVDVEDTTTSGRRPLLADDLTLSNLPYTLRLDARFLHARPRRRPSTMPPTNCPLEPSLGRRLSRMPVKTALRNVLPDESPRLRLPVRQRQR